LIAARDEKFVRDLIGIEIARTEFFAVKPKEAVEYTTENAGDDLTRIA
jgi:hypothetical protein